MSISNYQNGFTNSNPMVLGSIYGIRTMTDYYGTPGVLLGQRGRRMHPGWNIAQCFCFRLVCTCHSCADTKTEERTVHPTVPSPEGACGYYAGWTLEACGSGFDYQTFPIFIVEAAGRVMLGENGFRAEKIRAVAYCNPPQRLSISEKVGAYLNMR